MVENAEEEGSRYEMYGVIACGMGLTGVKEINPGKLVRQKL
jgi:hypothetical protein